MRIKEVPVYFARRHGKSRLMKNPFDYAAKAAVNLIRIERDYNPLKFFGRMGAFLFILGFLIGVYFIYLHFTTGISGHTGLMMLMLMLIFTSFHIIVFGLLADMNKK